MALKTISIEAKVGMFTVFVVIVALFLVIHIGIKRQIFAEKITYVVDSPTLERIDQGTPVRLFGFSIGQVSDIHLLGPDTLRLEIVVLKKYAQWFNTGTTLSLSSTSPLLGKTYLKVMPGAQSEPLVPEGTVFTLSAHDDMLKALQDDTRAILADIKDTTTNLKQLSEQLGSPDGDVRVVLARLRQFAESIDQPDKILYMLARDPEPASQLRTMLVNVDVALRNLNTLSSQALERLQAVAPLQDDIRGLVTSVQGFVVLLGDIGRKLDPAVTNLNVVSREVRLATQDLTRLRSQGEHTLQLSSEFLDRLNRTWPLSGGERPLPRQDHPMP